MRSHECATIPCRMPAPTFVDTISRKRRFVGCVGIVGSFNPLPWWTSVPTLAVLVGAPCFHPQHWPLTSVRLVWKCKRHALSHSFAFAVPLRELGPGSTRRCLVLSERRWEIHIASASHSLVVQGCYLGSKLHCHTRCGLLCWVQHCQWVPDSQQNSQHETFDAKPHLVGNVASSSLQPSG